MIGIRAVASYIPLTAIDNIQQGWSFGESEEFIRRRIGAWQLPRKRPDEETSDLALVAFRNLLAKTDLTSEEIEMLVVVTQNGDGWGLPQTSGILQRKLGLHKTVAAYDISLGCSGYVYGLTIVKGFLHASGLQHGVLVTADPYSKIIDPEDRITTLLFGDAASATWIGEGAEWDIAPPIYLTDGDGAGNLCIRDGVLNMNGRQVFNFAVQNVPSHITQILQKESLQEKDIDIFCLHQGSAAIIEAVARKFPSVKDRFILDMAETGNTVSSSIPLLLEKYLHRSGIKRVLLSGFGVGLSLATTVIQKREV